MLHTTDDLRIAGLRPLISPAILMEETPLDDAGIDFINQARQQASDIIQGRDKRLLVIVGPCSIHDTDAALAYAELLKEAAQEHREKLHIIMRVYFEKPRTTVGWKGLINDPRLDGSFKINEGLRTARKLLSDINAMGLPCGTEFLDTIIPQFISDLVSWGAIGARTTESQIHRELASGLSMPVGFKNGTEGSVQIAIDAMRSAENPHHFLSVTKHGIPAIVQTTGNHDCHIILRGSREATNFDRDSIESTYHALQQLHLKQRLIIDCSHGNSRKDHRNQAIVVDSLCQQLSQGNSAIGGLMLESNLLAGNQALKHRDALIYGKSITDACIAWDETQTLLAQLASAVTL